MLILIRLVHVKEKYDTLLYKDILLYSNLKKMDFNIEFNSCHNHWLLPQQHVHESIVVIEPSVPSSPVSSLM